MEEKNEKKMPHGVIRFDLPITFGDAKEVAHCVINGEKTQSSEERLAKKRAVREQARKCARENVRLLVAVCESADFPGEVAELLFANVSDHTRNVFDVYMRYHMSALGVTPDTLARVKEMMTNEKEARQ